jgi:hypothetical protein
VGFAAACHAQPQHHALLHGQAVGLCKAQVQLLQLPLLLRLRRVCQQQHAINVLQASVQHDAAPASFCLSALALAKQHAGPVNQQQHALADL